MRKSYKHPLGSPRNFTVAVGIGLSLGLLLTRMDFQRTGTVEGLFRRYEAFLTMKVEPACNAHVRKQYEQIESEHDGLNRQFRRIQHLLTVEQNQRRYHQMRRYLQCMSIYHLQ